MASSEIITFEDKGTTYTLEFDRETAVRAERAFGISMAELQTGKTYMVRDLFAAAFVKHHPHIKPTTVQSFYDRITDKVDLYNKLALMYAAAAGTLLEDPEDMGNAISWKSE